jgi:hypothetical protein
MWPYPKCAIQTLQSGRAWKVHVSKKHAGYSQEEWLAVTAAVSSELGARAPRDTIPSRTRRRRLRFSCGGDSYGRCCCHQSPGPTVRGREGQDGPRPGGTDLAAHRALSRNAPLSEEDRKTLTEGWEAALDCVDVSSQFAKREVALKSPLSGFLFPFLAVLLVIAERFDYSCPLGLHRRTEAKR